MSDTPRRRGRPSLGDEAAKTVGIRLTPATRARMRADPRTPEQIILAGLDVAS